MSVDDQVDDRATAPPQGPSLFPKHRELIVRSAITPEVAAARGYFSAGEKRELEVLGFADYQRRVPALVVPLHDVHGQVVTHQIRPDIPRKKRGGKLIKYETPAGTRLALDVPPVVRPLLGDPSRPLLVTEGARKADSAVSRGLCCVALLGVDSWRLPCWKSVEVAGRDVYIAFDSDVMVKANVQKALRGLSKFLRGRGAKVCVVHLPENGNGSKVGLDDYFASGKTAEDLFALAETADLALSSSAPSDRAKLPEIFISTNVPTVVTAAESALLAVPNAGVYQRAGMLVRVARHCPRDDEKKKPFVRPPGAPVISEIPSAHLFELAAGAARWLKEKDDDAPPQATLPPKWAIEALLTRGKWRLPALEGIVEVPVLRPDGSILETPGYDEATGLLFEPGAEFASLPEEITVDDARRALTVLKDVLVDFPFREDCDRSAALAMLLTPFARYAIDGPAPLFLVRAPTPGTGKSLLVDVAAMLATGRTAPRMAQAADSEEERKLILTIGLEGSALILIDNVERPLGSPALSAALTGRTFQGRLLGYNRTSTVPMLATWTATGNNVVMKGDTGRRVVPVDLDAKVEHPETRTGFRHSDVISYVREQRPKLAAAAVALLRAFHLNATEDVKLEPFGSFEAWSKIVRAALVWIGEPDPCAGRERIRRDSDPELEALGVVLEKWTPVLGPLPRLLANAIAELGRVDLVDAKTSDDEKRAIQIKNDARLELRIALAALDHRRLDPERLDANHLGYALRKHCGRIVNGKQLQGETVREGKKWCVVSTCGDAVIAVINRDPSREIRNSDSSIKEKQNHTLEGRSPKT